MKDSENKKLPDDPEIEPEMFMFFNRLLKEGDPVSDSEKNTDDADDCTELAEISDGNMKLENIGIKLSEVLTSIESLQSHYKQDKADTDRRIAVLTRLVSEMVSTVKAYTGASA